jgi:hypothetical protein
LGKASHGVSLEGVTERVIHSVERSAERLASHPLSSEQPTFVRRSFSSSSGRLKNEQRSFDTRSALAHDGSEMSNTRSTLIQLLLVTAQK